MFGGALLVASKILLTGKETISGQNSLANVDAVGHPL